MADNRDEQTYPDDTEAIEEADETLDIVRQMIVEAEALPEPVPEPVPEPEPEPAPAPAPAPVRPEVFARFAEEDEDLWSEEPDEGEWDNVYAGGAEGDYVEDDAGPARESRLKRWFRAALAWAWGHIWRFLKRPDAPRRMALFLLIVAIFVWPREVTKVSLLLPLAALITWASVGSQGVRELVVMWHGRLKARDPVKAERIRRAAAATSRGISRFVARLPGEWKRGFELPDFEPPDHVPEKMRVDPFENLAARVHAAKQADGHH